jgi:hypothetical protein
MKMKVFVSSEMNQAIDSERRDAVRKKIVDLGMISNCFEDLPGRRNPDDLGAQEMSLPSRSKALNSTIRHGAF